MPQRTILAVVFITLALVFYTIGVFWERKDKVLLPKHLLFFFLGLVCDTIGTTMMTEIAGGWAWNIHSLTGLAALLLMLFHFTWAALVLLLRKDSWKVGFHRLSLAVWLIWLVPYFTGMVLNMPRG